MRPIDFETCWPTDEEGNQADFGSTQDDPLFILLQREEESLEPMFYDWQCTTLTKSRRTYN